MNVSSGYRKNGFDAYGGKILKKEDMSYWMKSRERIDPKGVCFELGEEVEEVESGFSAGSVGGGEISFDLPKKFYLNMSAREVAAMCWRTCSDKIIENGILASVLEKAKEKKGFLLNYTV